MTAVAEYAASIIGEDVPVSWARAFRQRHPGLKGRWTTGLESCRARCLNWALISEYFDVLEELQLKYNFPPENIYNMDEKGIRMGVGARNMVLVDRDQCTVYHVEDGNRELVTVIETTSPVGGPLRPCVIYEGKTQLGMGQKKSMSRKVSAAMCGVYEHWFDHLISISFSPKGWTDNELGAICLEQSYPIGLAKWLAPLSGV
jgi:hypothetical protein